MIHRLTDPNDPGCFLWSDGAGAAVLEGGNLQGFVGAAFQADGAYVSGWVIAAGGTFEPASVEAVKAGRTQMRREKGHIFSTGTPHRSAAITIEGLLIWVNSN